LGWGRNFSELGAEYSEAGRRKDHAKIVGFFILCAEIGVGEGQPIFLEERSLSTIITIFVSF